MRMILIAMLLLSGVGCARYEYNITQPADLARHIGKDPVPIQRGPLVYRMQTYENRLVMQVENPTEHPVQLEGERSWIVTPDSESRPLQPQAIAPGAHVRVVLPPLAQRVARSGPSLGIGFGIGTGGRVGTGVGAGMPLYGDRLYFDEDSTWTWPAGAVIRLHLVGEHDGNPFTHDFIIDRQRM